MIRVISGDGDLAALEFQKHYRLPVVHLLDPVRQVELPHNRDGWPLLMLVDPNGEVVYKANNVIMAELATIERLLKPMLKSAAGKKAVIRDGVRYAPATLERSGEQDRSIRRDRFSSVACGKDARVHVALTSNRSGNSDIFLRTFDGRNWSEDRPVAATRADEYDPDLAVDKDSRVWASWTSNAGGGKYNIFVATIGDAKAPVRPTKVTRARDDAMHGRLARDGSGQIWLAYYKWQRMNRVSRDKEVYVRRHDGKRWSDEVQVSPTDVPRYEDHTDPAIAPYRDGVIVSWSWDFHRPKGYTRDAQEPTIFVRRVDSNMQLGRAVGVSGKRIDSAPAVAVDPEGYIWFAWESLGQDSRSGTYRKAVYVRQWAPDRKGSQLFYAPVADARANVCTPRVVAGPAGKITLVWSEKASTDSPWLLKLTSRDGQAERWSDPRTIESSGNPRFPSAAYDKKGDLWVAYSQETPLGRKIKVKRIPAGPAGE